MEPVEPEVWDKLQWFGGDRYPAPDDLARIEESSSATLFTDKEPQ